MTYRKISRELKNLIRYKQKSCTTEAEKNKAINDARAEINKKYGHDWRSKKADLYTGKMSEPSIYDGHTFGEHWMD